MNVLIPGLQSVVMLLPNSGVMSDVSLLLGIPAPVEAPNECLCEAHSGNIEKVVLIPEDELGEGWLDVGIY